MERSCSDSVKLAAEPGAGAGISIDSRTGRIILDETHAQSFEVRKQSLTLSDRAKNGFGWLKFGGKSLKRIVSGLNGSAERQKERLTVPSRQCGHQRRLSHSDRNPPIFRPWLATVGTDSYVAIADSRVNRHRWRFSRTARFEGKVDAEHSRDFKKGGG